MKRLPAALCLLALLCPPARAGVRGFVVFSSAATSAYEFAADRSLRLKASGPARRPDEHAVCAGRVFGVEPLTGRVHRLGPDLQEDRAASVGKAEGVARLLGCRGAGPLVFFDNTLAAFDEALQETGRTSLAPRRSGGIVPAVTADDFRVFAGKAYLLAANTGEVFVIDLQRRTSLTVPLGPDERVRGQWIDPARRTLNVLVARERSERAADLAPGESRLVKTEVVETFDLRDPRRPAKERVIHQESEIHLPVRPLDESGGKEGVVYERMASHRKEGPATGTYVSRLSATTPCFAEVFVEDGRSAAVLGPAKLAVLASGGKFTQLEPRRDAATGALWFESGGEVRVLGWRAEERRLDIQPKEYLELLRKGLARGDAALAY